MRCFIVIFLLISCFANAQNDSASHYTLYKEKLVLYSDLGFKSAPFSLRGDFPNEIKSLHYKHNFKSILGLGISYKWFGLRIAFGLPGELRPVSHYGESRFFDAGVKFSIKKTFWDIDLRSYGGYVIKDAYKWLDTLNELQPNLPRPRTKAVSVSLNSWYFFSDQFRMPAVYGINGEFNRNTGTWYLRSILNFFGVGDEGGPLLPKEMRDSTDTKTMASAATSLDLGVVPGYAFVVRKDGWQASMFGGLGAVLQGKNFTVGTLNRGFLGIAPRIDLRFVGGYSMPKCFFWFVSDFDIKSIGFQDLSYTQTFYSLSLVGGVRLNTRQKDKKLKNKN